VLARRSLIQRVCSRSEGRGLACDPGASGQGLFFPRRFWSAVRRPPVRRSALRVVRTLDSVVVSGTRRSLLRRSRPERRSLPFGSPGLPIRLSKLRSKRSARAASSPPRAERTRLKRGCQVQQTTSIRECDRNSSPRHLVYRSL